MHQKFKSWCQQCVTKVMGKYKDVDVAGMMEPVVCMNPSNNNTKFHGWSRTLSSSNRIKQELQEKFKQQQQQVSVKCVIKMMIRVCDK